MAKYFWNESGMECSITHIFLASDNIAKHNSFVVEGYRIYIQLPKDHPHCGKSVEFLEDTYQIKGIISYSDCNGKIGFDSILNEKGVMKQTHKFCNQIFNLNPSNNHLLPFCNFLEEQMRECKKEAKREKNPKRENVFMACSGGSTAKFCTECNAMISKKDTICRKCGKKFGLWDEKPSGRYKKDNEWVYF